MSRLVVFPLSYRQRKIVMTGLLIFFSLLTFFIRSEYHKVPILIVDEAFYAEVANRILDGNIEVRDNKPPGIFYLYATVFYFFGKNNLYVVHLLGTVIFICTAILLFLLVLETTKSDVAGLVASVTYLFLPSYSKNIPNFYAANTEIFMMFFVLFSLWIFARSKGRGLPLFVAGLSGAFTILFKQQGLIVIPMLIFLRLFQGRKNLIRDISILLSGLFLIVFLTVIFYWINGELWFLVHNILLVNMSYINQGGILSGLKTGISMTLQKRFWVPIFFLALVQFFRLLVERKKMSDTRLLWISWTIISFISLCPGWLFSGHYYYMVFPVVSGLFGIFSVDMTIRISKISKIATACAFVLISALLFYPLIHFTGFPPGTKRYLTYLEFDGAVGEKINGVSNYLLAHTKKTDRLFVWGFCPEIFTLTNRKSSSKYVHSNFLVGEIAPYKAGVNNTILNPEFWDELMVDLTSNPPEYIIDSTPSNHIGFASHPMMRYPLMKSIIHKQYRLEKRIGKMDLYRLKN